MIPESALKFVKADEGAPGFAKRQSPLNPG
jgi:hypothetical protein